MFYLDKEKNSLLTNCFYLDSDDWDDYSLRVRFSLFYSDGEGKVHEIGLVKIIKRDLFVPIGKKFVCVNEFIEPEFESLGEDFVSLGQDALFYQNCRKYIPRDQLEILFKGLRDCSFEKDYLKGFSSDLIKDRLCRSEDAGRMFVEGKFIAYDLSLDNIFNFSIQFSPLYNPELRCNISFNFNHRNKFFDNSVYCLIGNNGAGKSQILKSLPECINNQKTNFENIFFISNNVFEKEIKLDFDTYFHFTFLGLTKQTEGGTFISSREEQETELLLQLNKLVSRFYEEQYNRDYLMFGFSQIISLFEKKLDLIELECYVNSSWHGGKYEYQKFSRLISSFGKMSSGESSLFLNLIKVLVNISHYSLFLIDEPEVYLHPNFVSSYMRFLFSLLKRFNSFAIIATHSVFVVREVQSSCVYIVLRQENNCQICNVPRETLGANAMTICEDVFRTLDSKPYYLSQINALINEKRREGKDPETIENEVLSFLSKRSDGDFDLGLKMEIHYMVVEND